MMMMSKKDFLKHEGGENLLVIENEIGKNEVDEITSGDRSVG